MLHSIASMVSRTLNHHMLYDLELHHCHSKSYSRRAGQDSQLQVYPCRGIITRSKDIAKHNGLAKEGSMEAIILACSLAKKPCVGDIIIAACGPFSKQKFRISGDSGAVISTDASGATYAVSLVQ